MKIGQKRKELKLILRKTIKSVKDASKHVTRGKCEGKKWEDVYNRKRSILTCCLCYVALLSKPSSTESQLCCFDPVFGLEQPIIPLLSILTGIQAN